MTIRPLEEEARPRRRPWFVPRSSPNRRQRPTVSRRRLVWLALGLFGCLMMVGRWLVPLGYPTAIRQASLEADLDPYLVASVVFQESRGRANARSHVGAVGLMQLMPETAAWIGHRHAVSWQAEELADPELNLRLGTLYLRYLMREFANNETSALAAYNAGPGAVSGWQGAGSLEPDEIRYPETRHYVRRVQAVRRVLPLLYPELALR